MAASGYEKAIKRLNGIAERSLNPKEALQVIGRLARRRHQDYFRSNGPPGAPWPELERSTIRRKAKRGRSRKLVNEGELKGAYSYTTTRDAMRLLNKARQAFFLQKTGVGKRKFFGGKKKFVVVAAELKKQDPELLKMIKMVAGKFIRTGKTG